MKNTFEVRGKTVAIHLQGGHEALIDLVDLPLAASVPGTWYAHCRHGTWYATTSLPRQGGKQRMLQLHRFLMNPLDGFDTDHFDHDGLNNRRKNLRITTHSGNMFNRNGLNRNNTSGFRGVVAHGKKWVAQTSAGKYGKRKYLGIFNTKEEASAAFDKFFKEATGIGEAK
jgi:hypothetical protein